MQINTNVASLFSQRQLDRSQNDLGQALQRLSSGLRINSAKDDAAGMAIADRMTTQIRGFSQASRNANDGISMLQTAEGALGTVAEAIQRARELAVQAANSTNSASDKAALQAEVNQLMAEVNRVGAETRFNGQQIFSQDTHSMGGDKHESTVIDALKLGWLENSEKMVKDYYGLVGDGAAMDIKLTNNSTDAVAMVSWAGLDAEGKTTGMALTMNMYYFNPPTLPDGGDDPAMYADRVVAHEMVHAAMGRNINIAMLDGSAGSDNQSAYMWFIEGAAEFIHGGDERLKGDIAVAAGGDTAAKTLTVVNTIDTWALASVNYSSGYAAVRYLHDKLQTEGFDGIKDFMGYLRDNNGASLDQAMEHFFGSGYDVAAFKTEFKANGVDFITNTMNLDNTDTGAIGGLDADGGEIKTAETVVGSRGSKYGDDVLQGFREDFQKIGTGTTAANRLSFQVGAESRQTIDAAVGAVNSQALELDDIDIADDATLAIVRLDRALNYLNTQRAEIGAQLSRFEATIRNLETATISVTGARSRIMDADFADETAKLTRNQILQQAGIAMLTQANSNPQLALQLLS